jgi:hypothetical protein
VDGAFRGIWIALMRVVGLVGVEVRLDSGALGLVVALDRLLRSLLGGYCQYQYWWSYLWSAWTGAVGRSLMGTVNDMCVLGGESGRKKKHT